MDALDLLIVELGRTRELWLDALRSLHRARSRRRRAALESHLAFLETHHAVIASMLARQSAGESASMTLGLLLAELAGSRAAGGQLRNAEKARLNALHGLVVTVGMNLQASGWVM